LPEAFDVVIIGAGLSGIGATAVTLVPALAETAAQRTMLQRSRTYIFSRPGIDPFAARLRKFLPSGLACIVARRWPAAVRRRLLSLIQKELGPEYDVATHFSPDYNPWDQRLCLVPDGDLFTAIKTGRATVETGQIERFKALLF
jgi:cation diffusion facilitator CzcD-associated flavoprotein CzcO